jgi:hypothetical protein
VSITRRLFSPFKRQVPTSAYVYMPPKHTWWKAIAAFTAGGICVFALVRSPAGPQAAPEVSRSAGVAASASQASSPPQAFLAAPAESIPTRTDVATAATQPPEATPATAANAKANTKRAAARSAHRQTAKKHRYDSPFSSFARNFDPFSGGNRGSSRRYSGYGSGGFGYGSNAN